MYVHVLPVFLVSCIENDEKEEEEAAEAIMINVNNYSKDIVKNFRFLSCHMD